MLSYANLQLFPRVLGLPALADDGNRKKADLVYEFTVIVLCGAKSAPHISAAVTTTWPNRRTLPVVLCASIECEVYVNVTF